MSPLNSTEEGTELGKKETDAQLGKGKYDAGWRVSKPDGPSEGPTYRSAGVAPGTADDQSAAAGASARASGGALKVGGPGSIGPAWTRGEIEKPAGVRDMGAWTALYYTDEQQQRLGIDEKGNKLARNRDKFFAPEAPSGAASSGRFPAAWGEPPTVETRDYRVLPGGYGMGSSTLAKWIQSKLEGDGAVDGSASRGSAEVGVDGKLPSFDVKLPDGHVKLKDGSIQMPDGSIKLPSGSIKMPDGSFRLPSGSIKMPDGTIKLPDGSIKMPNGKLQLPDGTITMPAVDVKMPGASLKGPSGSVALPKGEIGLPSGNIATPKLDVEVKAPTYRSAGVDLGALKADAEFKAPGVDVKMPKVGAKLPKVDLKMPKGSIKLPDGSIKLPDGKLQLPDGTITMPDVKMPDASLEIGSRGVAVPGTPPEVHVGEMARLSAAWEGGNKQVDVPKVAAALASPRSLAPGASKSAQAEKAGAGTRALTSDDGETALGSDKGKYGKLLLYLLPLLAGLILGALLGFCTGKTCNGSGGGAGSASAISRALPFLAEEEPDTTPGLLSALGFLLPLSCA